jgi:hypothetical protein
LRSFDLSRDERSARRLAFASIESFDGGTEEFVEFIPSRRRSSAFSASNVSTRAANPTTSAASSSYEGLGGSGADTTADDRRSRTQDRACHAVTDHQQPTKIKALQQPSSTRPVNGHRLKSRLRPMRGLKRLRSARVISTGHAFIQNIRRGHYELGIEEPTTLRVMAAFTELTRAI